MGINQAPKQGALVADSAIEPSAYMQTRSKTEATPAKVASHKEWETIDNELSMLASQESEPPKSGSRKRKRGPNKSDKKTMDDEGITHSTPKKQRKTTSPKKTDEEKRLRHFRSYAPGTYLQKLERAKSQRMFVINRTHSDTPETPSETVQMAGTTGNIYDITISHLPSCTCPDNRKGNQCKHIIYVLHNVLKAPEHLQYQLAFLTSELHEIFSNAPLPASDAPTDGSTAAPSNRKEIAGDCPICFMEFAPANEEIVYCKAACGNNIHKDCFEQWARAQSSGGVKCVYCRTPWQRDEGDFKGLAEGGKKGEEGYVNIGAELGLSGVRDMSSYHQFWVRKQERRRWGRYGYDDEDEDYDD
ncbi:MAG: hypothetical protein Q9166_002187 [cf. Caloplaca sp. 2 TL-2023]